MASYVAGFIDGEGCIMIQKSMHSKSKNLSYNPSYNLIVDVGNTDLPILKSLQKLFGGSVYTRPNPRKQKIGHEWKVSGKAAFYVLTTIGSFLRIKRSQAKFACKFYLWYTQNIYTSGPKLYVPKEITEKREWYYRTLRQMKKE